MTSRRVAVSVTAVGVLLAVAGFAVVRVRVDLLVASGDVVVGCLVMAAGVSAVLLRPLRAMGLVLTTAGAAWFLGDFATVPGVIGDVSGMLVFVHRGVLAHAVFALPTGRLGSMRRRVAAVVAYALSLIPAIWTITVVAIVVAVAFVAAASAFATRAPRRNRRAARLGAWAAGALALGIALASVVRLVEASPVGIATALVLYEIGFVVAAGLILVATLVPSEIPTDVVIEAAEKPGQSLQDALAWAIGDPGLRLGLPRPGGGFADPIGEVVAPALGRERRVVRDGDRDIAMIDLAPGLLIDVVVASTLDTAVRLDARNRRLEAEVRARSEEVDASRLRLISAADDEQRRLEDLLVRGPETRLSGIRDLLTSARRALVGREGDAIQGALDALDQVMREIRRLGAGLYPRALDEVGLAAAIAVLVDDSPVPVEVVVASRPLPERASLAAYYLVSEGLANAAKHARASRIDVEIRGGDTLDVIVRDDGVGGMDVERGLTGIRERVAALGGTFTVMSPAGRGTLLHATLPLESVAK
jgi:signal transduction histidine kinase